MYLKRLQLQNYGPLRDLNIEFLSDEARPPPVLLVGKNGSGKTIALSHIVNAMALAKDETYQESKELDEGKVFKLRSNSYVSVGTEYYYARTDFESDLFFEEISLRKPKHTNAPPVDMEGHALAVWKEKFEGDKVIHYDTNITTPSSTPSSRTAVKKLVSERSLLYFPSNRAEEPAWLNQKNLRAKPQYTEGPHFEGETRRQLIAPSPLRDIHDWLYDVAYDRAAFEMRIQSYETQHQPLPVFQGYRGDATNAYNLALDILRNVIVLPELAEKKNLWFGIGGRHNRIISLESDQGTVVPNLFQLSSGEMALLALFLNILRDFDLRGDRKVPFASAEDVKGLVVVDEVDLHLHVNHQHDVLPRLIELFPNVQFIMTTHSPLFGLGMAKVFREKDFRVYHLPSGSLRPPELFDEFDHALDAFKTTSKFLDAAQEAKRPILSVEGLTDKLYLECAAKLLKKGHVLDKFKVLPAGGDKELNRIWNNPEIFLEFVAKAVVLLYDPESKVHDEKKGNIFKRKMPHFEEHPMHPISKGIENLFDKETLKKVRQQHAEFINDDDSSKIIKIGNELFDQPLSENIRQFMKDDSSCIKIEKGNKIQVLESWSVNKGKKTNLCNWLCAQGTREDFRHFKRIFEDLEQLPTPES